MGNKTQRKLVFVSNVTNCTFEDVCVSGKVKLDGIYWMMNLEGKDADIYISADGKGETIVTDSVTLVPTIPETHSQIDFNITQASGYAIVES